MAMTASWLERQAEKRDLAEVRVLGTALSRADLADRIVARVPADLFRRSAHRSVAEAIWSLRQEGRTAGIEEVLDRLHGQQTVDEVGGISGLYELIHYAEPDLTAVEDLLVIERRRQVWQTCTDGARDVTNPDVHPDDVAASVFGRLRDTEEVTDRSPITTDELLDMPRPSWLVEGIFPEGLNVMFGSPKSGKSYLALSMAWSVATGRPWFSRRTTDPQQVLYLAGEGVGDLRLRAESLLEHTNVHPGGRLAWWPVSLQLARESDAARLRLEVEKLDARVIIVDTWARYAGVRDENDAAQTQSALNALEALCRDGRSVIVVHHAAKSGVMRGSSALAGAVEAAIRVEVNDADGMVRLSSEMARRGSGFEDIVLAWRRIGPDSVLDEVRRVGL
jgi:hypothetical protein